MKRFRSSTLSAVLGGLMLLPAFGCQRAGEAAAAPYETTVNQPRPTQASAPRSPRPTTSSSARSTNHDVKGGTTSTKLTGFSDAIGRINRQTLGATTR